MDPIKPVGAQMTSSSTNKGFTVVEILMVIALIGILTVTGIDLIMDTINESRFDETVSRLESIKNAMIGDSKLMEGGTRTSFGYLGDIGSLPSGDDSIGIGTLLTQPTGFPLYSIHAAARIGIGWNGPYLISGGSSTDFTKDAWGNDIEYRPNDSPPVVRSLGADGMLGGTDYDSDIVYNLSPEQLKVNVNGFICKSAGPFDGVAQVELNYPDGSGALQINPINLVSLVVGNKGKFSFTSVPIGVRSITVYIPSKASPTTTIGPVLLTIDKPNFFVPCNKVEINP